MAGLRGSSYPVDREVDRPSAGLRHRRQLKGDAHGTIARGCLQPRGGHASAPSRVRHDDRQHSSHSHSRNGGSAQPAHPQQPCHPVEEEQQAAGPNPPDFSSEFEVDYDAPKAASVANETDQHRIAQRQRQIDFGKNTRGYVRYRQLVPKASRRMAGRRPVDPVTPDVTQICSKRAFDGQIKQWRRMLHQFDPPADEDEEEIDLNSIINAAAQRNAAAAEPEVTGGAEPLSEGAEGPGIGLKRGLQPVEEKEGQRTFKAPRLEDPEQFIYGNVSEDVGWAAGEDDDDDEWDVAI
mmetsp:Transcript_38144/g.107796  ORF Transcript_38144/g.107796 Transcript_38144/m.107796 type:complete len:294 (+) Transcript_38144:304-1185(+)|eukprot:CAMPEP_0117666752 /NCGR_PEP_ID=MMETSP0804-20121206/10557_1 /TAXON_ID=1074897 /ORGANISM="Tetraselmis astigmatica, Strain CCMP880" /LENGTH=293 /DNA_ID=CAMNT_0005474345 /DNA_START=250 /DNA_END=1131 /DNA_ORIENTATION=+